MTQKIALILIFILFLIEVAVGYVAHQSKKTTDGIILAANTASTQNKDKFGINNEQLPPLDSDGVDVPGIVRYPRLVRTDYQINSTNTTWNYQSHDLSSVIMAYYKSQFANKGWILISTDELNTVFINDGKQAEISTKNAGGITNLKIILSS